MVLLPYRSRLIQWNDWRSAWALPLVLILLAISVAAPSSRADDQQPSEQISAGQGPRALLIGIYARYLGSDATPGLQLETDTDIKRYFSPEMAQIIITGFRHSTPDEVPAWDFDFFVKAQDWIIPGVKIVVDDKPIGGHEIDALRASIQIVNPALTYGRETAVSRGSDCGAGAGGKCRTAGTTMVTVVP